MHQIDLFRINLNLLAVFEVLLEEGHVGRAADRLCLSQSATSHALSRLRHLFGDPLFVRHPGGMEPTPRARELAPRLHEALTQVRRVVVPVAPFDPATLNRSLTVATHDYAIATVLSGLMKLLRREAPGVDLRCISVSYDDLLTGFDRGTIDLACGAFPGFSAGRISRMPVMEDRLVGVVRAGHPILAADRVTPDAFVAFPHIWAWGSDNQQNPVDLALGSHGMQRRVAMTVPNALTVPLIVMESDLIGVIPERLAHDMAGRRDLVSFDLPISTETITCDLLMPAALTETADAQWIINAVRRAAAWTGNEP